MANGPYVSTEHHSCQPNVSTAKSRAVSTLDTPYCLFPVSTLSLFPHVQVAVVDGYAFPHQTKRLNVAGRHVTAHLLELLQRRGYQLNRTADLDTVGARVYINKGVFCHDRVVGV